MREIAVFSGSAHPGLAREVCAQLGVPPLPTRVSGEAMRRIHNGESVSALFDQ